MENRECIDRINAGSNTVTALQKSVKQPTVPHGQNVHLLKIGDAGYTYVNNPKSVCSVLQSINFLFLMLVFQNAQL